ncbi:MAG: CBS domain-containing protein [Candidatus Eisenbacteria bacterium]|uniref:CBS domain-containing protein n=1 Tax=Eiseniibacteriota bacterium TaxID=2212470 RepID=A0A538TJ72_UNCEI|nr:MAG: CBS domain-containing protein [Candidatus Eisenbacteria bacterium]TMQ63660.1 MAG: CBS domain-containing protein [Candidatus Eisenbacteria bacterium]
MRVREIMTSNPACCTADTPLREVAEMMVECDCGQIPVVDNPSTRRPVGVVTDRDIICRALARGENPIGLTARDVMSAPAITVPPDMRVLDCCRVLEEKQVRRAPVADEEGQCCGIISVADIAQTSPETLTGEVVRTLSERTLSSSGRERRLSV